MCIRDSVFLKDEFRIALYNDRIISQLFSDRLCKVLLCLLFAVHEEYMLSLIHIYFALLIEDRAGIDELLKCHEYVDLLIPRGSNQFVQYIMNNSKIPVMGHADGVCHIYVDGAASIEKAVPVIIDSKTQYVACLLYTSRCV